LDTRTNADEANQNQEAKYFHGIGVDKAPIAKFSDAITGKGCEEQIEDVFHHCCKHSQDPDSEIWLYGFSRGAYVVRAVAGLLHSMGVPSFKTRGEFTIVYDKALKLLRKKRKGNGSGGEV